MVVTVFGTVTSPYVRRVRAVAHELGLEVELVNTRSDEGDARLREVSPIWKIPVAQVGDDCVLDSGAITRHLLRHHGPGPMVAWDEADVQAANRIVVIDGALDALINVFYLAKDEISPDQASYVAKQQARAASAMGWLAERLPEPWLDGGAPLDLGALALYTTVDWMRFRGTYDVSAHPTLERFAAAQAARPSLVATAPPAG